MEWALVSEGLAKEGVVIDGTFAAFIVEKGGLGVGARRASG